MDIRIVLYIVIIGLGLSFIIFKKNSPQARRYYIRIIVILLILESGLRSVMVGPDTYSYFLEFNGVPMESWDMIFQNFYNTYVLGEGKDAGFHFVIKIIQLFSTNFNVFLLVIAVLFYIPLGRILYENTTSILQLMFALTLFVALFQIIALSGIRQQIATGGCLTAYLLLSRDRYVLAILMVSLSATIHISSLLFFLIIGMYILNAKAQFDICKPLHIISLLLIPIAISQARSIILYLASFIANDYYSAYGDKSAAGGAGTYVLFIMLLSLFCLIFISKKALNSSKQLKLMYFTVPFATMLSPLVMFDGAMIRLGQYFTLFFMMLFPLGVELKFRDSQNLIYTIVIVALMILSLNNDFNYTFFWQINTSALY